MSKPIPRARCFDPDFKYTPSGSTDISKTFARIRRELKAAEEKKPGAKVQQLRKATR